jgi:hypothetical protein
MLPEIQVKICITGVTLTPEKITNYIDILPTETWAIGDLIQKSSITRKHNGWCISTASEKGYDFKQPIKRLLHILKPKLTVIGNFCRENNLDVELSCIAYVVDETPACYLDKDIISVLSQLGASVDFDIILTE